MIVPGAPPPLGAFPHARRAGDLLFVSGVSSRRRDGSIAGGPAETGGGRGDIRVQTREVIGNIGRILAAAGGGLENLVAITSFLVDMADFAEYSDEYGQVFDAATGPARTTVAVRQLPHPDLLIEMAAIAHLGG